MEELFILALHFRGVHPSCRKMWWSRTVYTMVGLERKWRTPVFSWHFGVHPILFCVVLRPSDFVNTGLGAASPLSESSLEMPCQANVEVYGSNNIPPDSQSFKLAMKTKVKIHSALLTTALDVEKTQQ